MHFSIQGGSIEFIFPFKNILLYLLLATEALTSWITLEFHSYILCVSRMHVGYIPCPLKMGLYR